MANNNDEIIDLTESFTLVNHCSFANEIIVVDSEDSFEKHSKTNKEPAFNKKSTRIKKCLVNNVTPPTENTVLTKDGKNLGILGNCPICREELGKNRLASTKCGHVYCLKCIELSLRHGKRCPTCRKLLNGSTSYHPLFLDV